MSKPLTLTAFGVLVRKHRIDRQMSLTEMAKLVCFSIPYVSAMETGRKKPSAEYVALVAFVLNLNVSDRLALRVAAAITRGGVEFTAESGPFAAVITLLAEEPGFFHAHHANRLASLVMMPRGRAALIKWLEGQP